MPVQWRLASPKLMDHQQVIDPDGGQLTFTGSSDRIAELTAAYNELPRRRLVITGGPRNVRDFPTSVTARFDIDVVDQDEFLLDQWDLDPVARCVGR
jgi:hypothetical protein